MKRILIIEDDHEIARLIRLYLEQTGEYEVTVTHSAEAALMLLDALHPDCILLDVMLPHMDGITFCQQLRRRIYCPIIFISCLDDDDTIVRALNMGGDDYLVKPFSKSILLAYVEANIRRSQKMHSLSRALVVRDLKLDPVTHRVTKRGEEITLSPTEYELLHYLMAHSGEYVPFETLYVAVWGQESMGAIRPLFTHILNLRKKIEDDVKTPVYIKTHQRNGYIFAAN